MKSEKLTSFALMIAAIALLAVGAMSYRDYLKAKYEKEFGVPSGGAGQVAAPPPNPQSPPPGQGQLSTVETPVAVPQPVATANTPATPPVAAAPDPRLSEYQRNLEALRLENQDSLEALRQENALYRAKLEEAGNGSGTAPGTLPGGTPDPRLPSSAVAAARPPGPLQQTEQAGSPNTRQEISALEEKVRKEASVAKVVEFDSDWAFVVLDGGRNRGIQHDMRFAVRRDGEILGWIKITEVEENRAVADLMSQNKDSQTSRKPAPGDDIIAFNLF